MYVSVGCKMDGDQMGRYLSTRLRVVASQEKKLQAKSERTYAA